MFMTYFGVKSLCHNDVETTLVKFKYPLGRMIASFNSLMKFYLSFLGECDCKHHICP